MREGRVLNNMLLGNQGGEGPDEKLGPSGRISGREKI